MEAGLLDKVGIVPINLAEKKIKMRGRVKCDCGEQGIVELEQDGSNIKKRTIYECSCGNIYLIMEPDPQLLKMPKELAGYFKFKK